MSGDVLAEIVQGRESSLTTSDHSEDMHGWVLGGVGVAVVDEGHVAEAENMASFLICGHREEFVGHFPRVWSSFPFQREAAAGGLPVPEVSGALQDAGSVAVGHGSQDPAQDLVVTSGAAAGDDWAISA